MVKVTLITNLHNHLKNNLKEGYEKCSYSPYKRINLLFNSKIYNVVNLYLLLISHVSLTSALTSFSSPSISLFLPFSFLSNSKTIHITPYIDKIT